MGKDPEVFVNIAVHIPTEENHHNVIIVKEK
jgi:hypothetical protein